MANEQAAASSPHPTDRTGFRRAALASGALLLAPAWLAVGPGLRLPFADAQLSLLFHTMAAELSVLRILHLSDAPAVWLWLPALVGVAVTAVSRRSPRLARRFAHALGASAVLPLLWVLLVATSLHWVLAVVVLVAAWLAPRPSADRLQPRQVGVTAACALGILLAASATSEQGSGPTSPPFVLGALWVRTLGASPLLSGGAFLAAALGLWWRSARGWRAPDQPWLVGAALALVGFELLQGLPLPVSTARLLAALGVLVGLAALAPHAGPLRTAAGGSVAAAASMLIVGMWTQPGPTPHIEVLDPRTDAFSIATDPQSGTIAWSVRSRGTVEWLAADGTRGSFGPEAGGWGPDDDVEALYAHDGRFWVSVWTAQESGALVSWTPSQGPGASIGVGSCNPTAWLPVPTSPGRVLLGCEGDARLSQLDLSSATVEQQVWVQRGVENAVFSDDRSRLFSVMLWASSALTENAWPSGRPVREHHVGPMNWTLTRDVRRSQLALGRFVEGELLVLEQSSLSTVRRVPLSFGIRALVRDEDRDRYWAAAAYSGLLWMVPGDGGAATPFPVCGQARDLIVDAQGRAVLGTDCGILRVSAPGE